MKSSILIILLGMICLFGWSQVPDVNELIREANKKGKQRLDSIYSYDYDTTNMIWNFRKRTRIQYFNVSDRTSLVETYDPTNQSWTPTFKLGYTSDDNTLTESFLGQQWDASNSSWVNSYMDTIVSNAQGEEIFYRHLIWDIVNNSWQGQEQMTTTYFMQGTEFEEVVQLWDVNQNQWVNFTKSYLKLRTSTRGHFDENWNWNDLTQSWDPNYRTTITFDSLGATTLYKEDRYNSTTQLYENYWQFIYTNNSQGRRTEEVRQKWSPTLMNWQDEYLILTKLDTNGDPDSVTTYFWDSNQLKWNQQALNLFDFNAFRYTTDQQAYAWRNTEWEKNYRVTNAYNAENNRINNTYYTKGPNANLWIENNKSDYYWSDTNVGISNPFPNLSCEIPNPIHQGVSYRCTVLEPNQIYELHVTDITGKQVQQTVFKGNEPFSLKGNYPKGLYVISISGEGKLLYRNKVVVE